MKRPVTFIAYLIMNKCFVVPLVIDGYREAEPYLLDVLADVGIEGIGLRVGVGGNEAIDLVGEAGNAVTSDYGKLARLGIVGLHLGIAKSLLQTRKAQKGGTNKYDNKNMSSL